MTDSTIPSDRVPERSMEAPALAAAPKVTARVVPVNPYLRAIAITIGVLLLLAVVCWLVWAASLPDPDGGNDGNPALGGGALVIANWAFSASIFVAIVWTAVKAVLWGQQHSGA